MSIFGVKHKNKPRYSIVMEVKKMRQMMLLLCMFTILLSCGSETNIDGPRLTLNKTTLILQEGAEEALLVSGVPEGEAGNVIWASSSPEVATVSVDGKVKAVKTGESTVLVVAGNASATCQITVQRREPQKNVYVAGYQKIGSVKVATLWKNGEPIRLSDGTANAEANSVYVVGDDVYVAGYAIYGSSPLAIVWKNGDPIPVSYRNSYAESVFVYNNQIYTAGREYIRMYVATSWKGLEATGLADRLSYGMSVFVENGNVYIGGRESGAMIWENGTPMTLKMPAGTTSSRIESVCASKGNVYGVGSIYSENNVAMVWKNGDPIMLTDGKTSAGAESVFVAGDDVYVAGFDTYEPGRLLAMLWKNGEPIRLTDGTSSAYAWSVYVADNQVYVAGHEQINKKYFAALLWVDGVAVRLTDGSTDAEAYDVFVVPE